MAEPGPNDAVFDLLKDAPLSFSRWCRKALLGEWRCMCWRCRTAGGRHWDEYTERMARIQAEALDASERK